MSTSLSDGGGDDIQTISGLTTTGIESQSAEQPLTKELDASITVLKRSKVLRTIPGPGSKELWAQNICSDHMAIVKWTLENGWERPEIKEFGNLELSPVASCLHYATQCFEGMKVYRGFDGKLRLFRPDCNAERLKMSALRVALPGFAPDQLVELIKQLVKVDGSRWLPKAKPGNFLYVRPAMIGSGRQIGVQLPNEALLFVVAVPWPDFSTESPPGSAPRAPGLRLIASKSDATRAWPGGFGYAKLGANYGPSFVAHGEAQARGYDQILWLLGNDCQVTEAGASNFFVVIRNPDTGVQELITAPLTDKVILAGVTRRSVLELARTRLKGELEVVERKFTMFEVQEALDQGRLVEAFVSGTAFFIYSVAVISFMEKDLPIPMEQGNYGRVAAKIRGWLTDIMYGNENHEWGVVVVEEE